MTALHPLAMEMIAEPETDALTLAVQIHCALMRAATDRFAAVAA